MNNLDILTHQNEVRRLLGYCPQFDALIDTLTAREHLRLFARIKGVPEDIMDEYCEHLILRLGLQEGIADKPTKGYSGGNKRKLCVGIALIGNPPIVFLSVTHKQQLSLQAPLHILGFAAHFCRPVFLLTFAPFFFFLSVTSHLRAWILVRAASCGI